MNNLDLLKRKVTLFNKQKGARVGDFLKLPHGEFVRFTHDWEDHLQTGTGGSYFLGEGYLSYSGGLDTGVDLKK